MVNAIILAGSDASKIGTEYEYKALIKLNGRYMIEYVLDAVVDAKKVKRIVVVGPREMLVSKLDTGGKYNRVEFIDQEDSLIKNAKRAIEVLEPDTKVLFLTSDLPFITSEAIDEFINQALETGADICYPIVEKNINDSKYPEMKRTYGKVKEGTFTGGNAILINPEVFNKCYKLAEKLVEKRKNPIAMARVIGPAILLLFLTKKLSIKRVEKRVSKVFKVKAKAIITTYPEIGQDVDKDSDLKAANQYLNNKLD